MTEYYLGIDIGASSGRHILAHMEDGRMVLEEIHRFPNGMSRKDGELCWDTGALFHEIKTGMKKCAELGKIPVSVGIDTWAVDFVLLDEADQVIGNTVGYRDSRTQGMDDKVYETISLQDLYHRTGIQKQMFNSIYQLMAIKEKKPQELEKEDLFDDSRLFSFPVMWTQVCRIYQFYHNTVSQPDYQNLGHGVDRSFGIS